MLRRLRIKSVVALLAVACCVLVFLCTDFGSSRQPRSPSARRLHIVRITSEDIAKLEGGVEPPELPSSLLYPQASPHVTAIPLPSSPRAVPFLSFSQQQDTRSEGNLQYDLKDVPSVSLLHNPKQVLKTNSLHPSSKGISSSNDVLSHNIDKTDKLDNYVDKSVYTKEKEFIELAAFESIPAKKRKRLERYLSHLSQDQFDEVFRNVLGYENNQYDLEMLKFPNDKKVVKSPEDGKDITSTPKSGKSLDLTNRTRSQDRGRCLSGCPDHKPISVHTRGYAARVKIESVTLPPEWSSSPEDEQRLQLRKSRVKEVCHRHGLDIAGPNNSINAWEFLINKKFNLVWCSVFKAASSTWFYNFNILAGYSENFLLRSKETPITLARQKYARPTTMELENFMNQTQRPLSFLIARHPLHRLVSAYRDKLLSGKRYYSRLARDIVSTYPSLGEHPTTDSTLGNSAAPRWYGSPSSSLARARLARKLVVPTFPQLVQYLIDSNARGEVLDEHWTPISQFCTPCLFEFDVIAKMETLDEDSNYVIFKSGIEKYIKPKRINRNRNAPTGEVADSFLCQLSTEMMKKLIEIYRVDMELFGYEYEHYLNCTKDHIRLERIYR
ncbi:carbohydrate sulfotransferase 9-like isoform X2 [Hyalella azteca]|uniref:Carbohydrate sulfotransferase n=1 Tax=Hyalella azteca TaxID=294128 RepID=A0A8B7P1X0_HYAAZ|nr:carbohydrate sulfotransferase 9-like isoform X2 [Hyalella azteca]